MRVLWLNQLTKDMGFVDSLIITWRWSTMVTLLYYTHLSLPLRMVTCLQQLGSMGVTHFNRTKYGDHDNITEIHEVSTVPHMEYQHDARPQTQSYTNGMYYNTWAGTKSEGLSQGAMTWLAPNYAKRWCYQHLITSGESLIPFNVWCDVADSVQWKLALKFILASS